MSPLSVLENFPLKLAQTGIANRNLRFRNSLVLGIVHYTERNRVYVSFARLLASLTALFLTSLHLPTSLSTQRLYCKTKPPRERWKSWKKRRREEDEPRRKELVDGASQRSACLTTTSFNPLQPYQQGLPTYSYSTVFFQGDSLG